MLTARTFAKEKGVSYTTIMAWLREGLIPGAAQQETPMGMVWQIPSSSLKKVEKRKPGPKVATSQSAANGAETSAEATPFRPKTRAEKRAKKSAKKGGGTK